MGLQVFSQQRSSVFAKLSIFRAKCGKEVAVDVEFAGDLTFHKNGHHNFGFGFQGASKIA